MITCPGSTAFAASFGFLPDLELFEDDAFPDAVPDMVPVWGTTTAGSIVGAGSIPGLSNAAEIVILYNWQAGDDLVTDIDVFSWKDPSSTTTSFFFDKTGVTIGGSTYAPDTPVTGQHPFGVQLEFGLSYQRTDVTEGGQIAAGGNGVDGRNETSEDFNATFTDGDAADPARPGSGGGGVGGTVELVVPAATFIPTLGETFPIRFVSKSQSETKVRIFDLEGRLVANLFDSRFDGAPSVIPGAYTVAVWDLKKGVKFAPPIDREVTAQDFKYSFERMMVEPLAPATFFYEGVVGATEFMEGKAKEITGFKVVDDYTVEITLKKPEGAFLMAMTMPFTSVLPEEWVKQVGKQIKRKPLGTGPYIITDWTPGPVHHRGEEHQLDGRDQPVGGRHEVPLHGQPEHGAAPAGARRGGRARRRHPRGRLRAHQAGPDLEQVHRRRRRRSPRTTSS